ncbi:efflux RND transporter periplasmic adaptor subunit [uncultured Pseudomonas sp.]|uniref:efflux RND transporter periplasmic adaptor subunit n=1 Tax=uncultured Pseudomonas sp. TaxID=114707 RepID=UPI0025CC6FAB|nr:efflux RND transporter periplasmic adaptor subunit [uncultured Pseudomonas sp.]
MSGHSPTRRARLAGLGFAAFLTLGGCSQGAAPGSPPPRAVKLAMPYSLDSAAPVLPGVIRQAQNSALAFEQPGRVTRMTVEVGAQVAAGQVLVEQDGEAARLRLAQAEARRRASAIDLTQRRHEHQRTQQLFSQGNASAADLERSDTALQTARTQAQVTDAEAAQAGRELNLTRLVAPFAGRVVSRVAQPLRQVAAGEVLLTLQGNGPRQVVVQVPSRYAQRLKPGDRAQGLLAAGGGNVELSLIGLSPVAENGLLQEAVFELPDGQTTLPSGSVLNVQLPADGASSLAVASSALLPGQDAGSAQVYLFMEGSSQVVLRNVRVAALQGDQALISAGLQPYDQVVVAGAAFLRPGERVTRYQPTTVIVRD